MRHTLTLVVLLSTYMASTSQIEPDLVAFVDNKQSTASADPLSFDTNSLDKLISFSEGFTDSSFHHQMALHLTEDQRLTIETDFPRALQYSISNVEGIILRKGKFFGSGIVNLASLKTGSYAVYFFSGNKIMRALMIEHQRAAM